MHVVWSISHVSRHRPRTPLNFKTDYGRLPRLPDCVFWVILLVYSQSSTASLRLKALVVRNIDPRTPIPVWDWVQVIRYKGCPYRTCKLPPTVCNPSFLCPRQLGMSGFLRALMRTLPSSLRNRLRSPRPSHGLKSGSYLFSSLQNHSHPRSFTPLHQRSVTS